MNFCYRPSGSIVMNSSNRNILGARQPDLCLIVTANPSWPDITNAIPSGSHWNHHPGIVASAFNFQINAFMRLICDDLIFGNVSAHYFRIEWQVVSRAIYISRYYA